MHSSPESYRADFILARRKLVEELLTADNSADALADRLSFVTAYDLMDGFHDHLLRKLSNLRMPDLAGRIAAELKPGDAVWGVYGPPAAVAAARAAVMAP
jgi:hypothetical protein